MGDADALLDAYDRDAAAKEARIAALLGEAGFGEAFRGMRRTPVERGYRMRASVYLGRDAPEDAAARGVDPRHGRMPLEETLWVLPEAARPLVREVTARLAAAPREAGATGFEVRLEFGSGRAHVTVAAERGSAGSVRRHRHGVSPEVEAGQRMRVGGWSVPTSGTPSIWCTPAAAARISVAGGLRHAGLGVTFWGVRLATTSASSSCAPGWEGGWTRRSFACPV